MRSGPTSSTRSHRPEAPTRPIVIALLGLRPNAIRIAPRRGTQRYEQDQNHLIARRTCGRRNAPGQCLRRQRRLRRSAPQGASGSASTVAVDGVNGVGDVLVDARGAALYAADQESNGTIACTGSCTTIWDPLTVHGAKAPTAGSDVMGMLGVVKRPDGARQVTLDGRPLYRFAEDPETGPSRATASPTRSTASHSSGTWPRPTACRLRAPTRRAAAPATSPPPSPVPLGAPPVRGSVPLATVRFA